VKQGGFACPTSPRRKAFVPPSTVAKDEPELSVLSCYGI
jgi:hypothetical protein